MGIIASRQTRTLRPDRPRNLEIYPNHPFTQPLKYSFLFGAESSTVFELVREIALWGEDGCTDKASKPFGNIARFRCDSPFPSSFADLS
jgi:hypothetical protein